jgi:hypothetical protein
MPGRLSRAVRSARRRGTLTVALAVFRPLGADDSFRLDRDPDGDLAASIARGSCAPMRAR